MEHRPPTPICKSFVVCQRIVIDRESGDYVIINPLHKVIRPVFPALIPLSFYARWTNAHGAYKLSLQFRTLEGDILWDREYERPVDCDDPLKVGTITLRDELVRFPGTGKFEFAMLANGAEVAADVFWVRLPTPA